MRRSLAPATVAGRPRRVEVGSRIDSHHPAMTVRRYIAIYIKIIATRILPHQRMHIRRHLQMRRILALRRPAIHPIPSQRRIAVGARHISEHLIEGAVLTDDQKAML